MAEAVVSLLIESLGSMGIDRIEEEIRLVTGVKVDVQNLTTNLKDIEAVLEDAEEKQLNNVSLKRWVQKLKNASDDMEYVLDEWSTAILEYNIKKEEEKALKNNAASSSTAKKVCFPMPISCFSFTKVDRLIMRRDIALKIRQLNKELVTISKDKYNYNLNINTAVEKPRLPHTTFLINQTEIHGRDEEKSLLISKLLFKSSSVDWRSNIIPIVGLAGLGKTTLAQLAYNNETVKTHFDKRIWVSVSEPFEEIKVAKAIVDGLGSSTQSSELNDVVKCIHEAIEGKRVLIVLDDVWLEDYIKWEILGEALRNWGTGSRVLVTTRKQEVAIMMGAATNQIRLRKLSEEHCWSIFRQLAFMGRTTEERAQLEPIGKKIAAKSKGLPLVAKTLGSLVRFKKYPSQWEDILVSRLWESHDPKVRDVFAPFLLSYYDLPPLEKRCFLYCSVFPQDYDIQEDDLIEMWMSQGFLGREIDSWKKGRDCFESLTMRSFFQDFKADEFDGVVRCKMHDIVHDFAHFLTGDECSFIDVDEEKEQTKGVVKENTRHLTLLVTSSESRPPNSVGNAKNLRTLFVQSNVIKVHDEMLLLPQLTRLRTLNLQSCGFEQLSEDVGLLKHLRYLDLSGNYKLLELPEKLFNLCNLETLKLRECLKLKSLPESISKLVNLQHLYINMCPLDGLPKGIGKLSRLRTLDTIVVPSERESHLDVGDLNTLKHLQFQGFLGITQCGNAGSTTDAAAKMNLIEKPHLIELVLSFRDPFVLEENVSHNDTEILDSIHPHPNLKSLGIWNYLGLTVSPPWMMSLSSLTRLKLIHCLNCETLPPLGILPSLEYLELCYFTYMYMVDEEFLGITESDQVVISFPRLEELVFSFHPQWRHWEGSCTKTITIMPRLHTLGIDFCSSLETLPDFLQLTPLQKLSIARESKKLQKHCQKEVGKEWHKISHVPNILFNGKYVQKDGVWTQTEEITD